MPLIGTVADDLTGATTTGVLLARSKARTAVFFNVEAASKADGVDELDAIIISSNSRPLPANEAYEKVKDATIALKNMGVKYFQKRTDTTMRGGIGVEIDAMLDQLSEDTVAVVVPAMPQSRRILVGGFSVIDGVALINTPVAQDVRTPVKENYIPRLLEGQTRRKVGLVTLDKVLAGDQVIKTALSIGAKTDVKTIVTAGASGIVLGLISAATAVIFFFVINLLLPKKERNAMGAAIGTTALNSAMTPAAVAEADPTMAEFVPMATAQCATASIITLFLCPFITAAFDKYMQKKQKGIYSPEGWAYAKVAGNN